MVAFLFLAAPGLAPAANKCIVNGKTVYQDAECPRGSQQKPMPEHVAPKPAAQAGGAFPKLPELQRGQWKLSGMDNASTCGHPLQSFYSEYQQFEGMRKFGCTVDASSPSERSVAVSVECPVESRVGRVQTSFTLSSPNPQSFSLDTILSGKRKTLNGVRIGEC